ARGHCAESVGAAVPRTVRARPRRLLQLARCRLHEAARGLRGQAAMRGSELNTVSRRMKGGRRIVFIIAVALSSVAHRIIALPLDPIVAWSLLLGTLMASGGIVLLLGDYVRSEDGRTATRRQQMKPSFAPGALLAAALMIAGCSNVGAVVRRERAT